MNESTDDVLEREIPLVDNQVIAIPLIWQSVSGSANLRHSEPNFSTMMFGISIV
jgi:hypothetical protein